MKYVLGVLDYWDNYIQRKFLIIEKKFQVFNYLLIVMGMAG